MKNTPALALTVVALLGAWGTSAGSPAARATPAQTQPAPSKPRPLHMVGVVKNSQGKPLAGVRVGADNTELRGTEVWTVTDAKGRYDLDLSGVPVLSSWVPVAHMAVKYNGQQHTLFPEADNPAAFLGRDGAVRNFTLKITGKSPGGGYYGARFYAHLGLSSAGDMPEFGDVEFTLAPQGPLIDGTTGDTVVLKQEQLPFEVPQGRYRVTARSLSGKGPIWLKPRGGEYGPVAVVDVIYWAGTGNTLEVDMMHPRR